MRGWRPIPAALLSHSVFLCSGTEDISLPTQRLQTTWSRPTQGKTFPDKQGSIRRKLDAVKSFATTLNNSLWKSATWHHSCCVAGSPNVHLPHSPAALGSWLAFVLSILLKINILHGYLGSHHLHFLGLMPRNRHMASLNHLIAVPNHQIYFGQVVQVFVRFSNHDQHVRQLPRL